MSDDFERELRQALQPVDPPGGFAERVMAKQARARTFFRPERGWLMGAVAAMSAFVVIAIVVEQRHEHEGRQARRQLIEALHVTSEKLDLAYRASVNR